MKPHKNHSLIPDRARPGPAALPSLRRERPTRPASEFLNAVAHEMPDREAWAIKAGIARAAELLHQGRIAKGVSQQDLARTTGTSQSVISDIERGAGSYGPSFGVFFKIIDALGLDITLVKKSARTEKQERAIAKSD